MGANRFELPRVLRDRFMREGHLEHGAAMGHLEATTTPLGKQAVRFHQGPSRVLEHLGLRDGDVIVKINGRLVEHEMQHFPESIYLRVLLKLEDGAIDLEVDRGADRVHLELVLKE